jgi:hypothetical protein
VRTAAVRFTSRSERPMSTDTANLMQKVYDLFSALYASKGVADAFLAFETGVPFTKDMFTLNGVTSPALAIESQSGIANAVLTVQGDFVERTSRTVEGQTGFLLEGSTAIDADSMALLGAIKTPAKKAFESMIGSFQGYQYHPVYASPANWYDPTANDNWTMHNVGQQDGPPPSTPTPPPRMIVNPPRWHVLPAEMRPALAQPAIATPHILIQERAMMTAMPATPSPVAQRVVRHNMVLPTSTTTVLVGERSALALSAAIASTNPQPPATAVRTINPMMVAQLSAELHASTTPQPVAANSINISFEHCVVTLMRPWFPEQLLMGRNWYIPGYAASTFSSGKGIGDTGLFPILTSGFVAIRNLSISSKWSAPDLDVVQGSAAFGPFSLVGRNYDSGSGTLTCSGTQIIGWFCSALPPLPPLSDPALVSSASAPVQSTPPASGTSASGAPDSATPGPITTTTTPGAGASATGGSVGGTSTPGTPAPAATPDKGST